MNTSKGTAPQPGSDAAVPMAAGEAQNEPLLEYDKATARNLQDSFSRYHKADYLRELGRHEDAVAEMDILLGQKPRPYDSWLHEANSLRALARHRDAIKATESNISTDSDSPLYYTHRAQSTALLA